MVDPTRFLLPAADPDDPPYRHLRINQDWLPYVTGAVLDYLLVPDLWRTDTEDITGVPTAVWDVVKRLSIDTGAPLPDHALIHPFHFVPVQGAWTFQSHDSYATGSAVYNTNNAQSDAADARLRLSAGQYRLYSTWWQGPGGGYTELQLRAGGAGVLSVIQRDQYSTTPNFNITASTTFTLNDDFEGELRVTTGISPTGGVGNQVAVIQALVFARID